MNLAPVPNLSRDPRAWIARPDLNEAAAEGVPDRVTASNGGLAVSEKFRVSRREVLGAAGLVLLGDAASRAAAPQASPQRLAMQAAIWGFPLVDMGRYFALAQKAAWRATASI